MDPDWQALFRLWVGLAYDDIREMLIAMSVESADPLEKISLARVSLNRLRQFLVDTAEDAAQCGFYAGSMELRDAYLDACRMFAVIKARLDSGQENFAPLISLARIHAKLSGEDPVKLIRDAKELGTLIAPPNNPGNEVSRSLPPAPDDSKHLGLILDRQRRKVQREGLEMAIEFRGKIIPWNLLEKLVKAKDAYLSIDDLGEAWKKVGKDKPGTDRLYPELSKLRNMILPLRIGIDNAPSGGWKLVDLKQDKSKTERRRSVRRK
jgi:hypothetical protein